MALAKGDHCLLGVVLNCLLAWPDCCFRSETVAHPRTKTVLANIPVVLGDEASPKEEQLLALCGDAKREDWVAEQVDRGIDVLVCHPELVKTELDLLAFPSIVFMQSGYNVHTLMQATRRSWRIGQKQSVEVYFLGYERTAQIQCLSLMAKKIAVSQST